MANGQNSDKSAIDSHQPQKNLHLPTPPSTSHSTSTSYSRPDFNSSVATAHNRDIERDDAALRTPTQTPPTSLSPVLASPEPDPQSKPSFEPPSSPSSDSESLPSRPSYRRRSLDSPFSDEKDAKSRVSLSTRLEFLSRLALTEQRVLPDESVQILHRHLDKIQHGLVEPADLDSSGDYAQPVAALRPKKTVDIETLRAVQASQEEICAITKRLNTQIHLRQEESAHVYGLFTTKLEALAQKCISLQASLEPVTAQLRQARQILQAKEDEIDNLVIDNNTLELEAQRLRDEAAEKELVMRAMGAAVGGLEGWVENLQDRRGQPGNVTPLTPRKGGVNIISRSAAGSTPKPGKRQREVLRGKGRFRGKYIIEEDDPTSPINSPSDSRTPTSSGRYGLDGTIDRVSDNSGVVQENAPETEIVEGLRAWIKGFRDVEEGLRRTSPTSPEFSTSRQQNRRINDEASYEYG
ncbi:MAG: hypothetical protein Q9227_009189 [Pyrenula ochraceoflavens]